MSVIDAISEVGCGASQSVCNDTNKLSTFPVTVVSVELIDPEDPWYKFGEVLQILQQFG